MLCVSRSVEDSQDPLSQMEFRLPADALVPLPGSALPPRPRPAAAPISSDPFDAFGSAPAAAAAARDDFADLESLGAIGAPKAQAAAGTVSDILPSALLLDTCATPGLSACPIVPHLLPCGRPTKGLTCALC